MNFNLVYSRLIVGSAPRQPEDVTTLRGLRVSHVLNVCTEYDDRGLLAGTGIQLCQNARPDDGQPKDAGWFYTSMYFGLGALCWPKACLYIHCAAGMSRGPSSAYAILRACGLSSGEAAQFLLTKRPGCHLTYQENAEAALTALLR